MTTRTSDTALAVIQRDVEYMKSGIDEVKIGIKEINARFATKEEVDDRIKQIEDRQRTEVAALKDKIGFLEKGMYGAIAFILYQVGQYVFTNFVK